MLKQLDLLQKHTREALKRYGPEKALIVEDERLCAASREPVRVWGPRLSQTSCRRVAATPDSRPVVLSPAAVRPCNLVLEAVRPTDSGAQGRAAVAAPVQKPANDFGAHVVCALSAREHLHVAQVMGSDASESSMNETVARLPVVSGARRYGLVAF